MSFYEDNVADGSHCGNCCQFIGQPVGHPLFCTSCEEDLAPVNPLTNSQKRNARKRRAKALATKQGGQDE
jgi:hypothetical protein